MSRNEWYPVIANPDAGETGEIGGTEVLGISFYGRNIAEEDRVPKDCRHPLTTS